MVKIGFYSTKHVSNIFAYIYYQIVFRAKKGIDLLLLYRVFNSDCLFFTRKIAIMKDTISIKIIYKHYKKVFDINNKLYNYIYSREYYISILIIKKTIFAILAIISILVIIIIVETFLLTTYITSYIAY